ncbi:MAG: fused MFS/spermidine synthase [Candidatus Obscuribacterales bacterium]|jgi:spermidine synthase|nr:fused MFS/spermidine synthase [Candidatus Obscuribacterales bacterium]
MATKSFVVVSLLFFVSGISSLVYQVIWTRSLVLVFGSTQFATATVLAVFMAGLGFGALVSGKLSNKVGAKALLWYGLLEGFIGVWALLAPSMFSLAVPIYQSGFQAFHLNPLLFGVLRFLVASIILLPPTTCMGATLPLLSSFVANQIESVGNRIGTLYAVNTFGAVCGALLGGFVFLPSLGLSASTVIAAVLNIVLFILAFLLFNKSVSKTPGELVSASQKSEVNSKEVMAVLACFFVSGALSMFYEIGWTRILLLLIGSTTYAFTVMLSTFLLGIFLGSYVCAKFVDKLRNPIGVFALGQIYLCFAVLLSLTVYNFLPYLNLLVVSAIGSNETLSMLLRFCAASAVLLPITLCLGALFPLGVKICSRNIDEVGDSVGQLYSINTFGAIIGAFVAGFLAIPLVGCENTLVYAAIANLVLGLLLLFSFGAMRTSIKAVAATGLILLIAWASNKASLINEDILVFAQYEKREILGGAADVPSWPQWLARLNRNISFFKDGICANVAVSQMHNPPVTLLFTNGHCDASDRADMENQVNLALLPMLLNSSSKHVCVIGWGSGVTAAYSLRFPVQSVVCAEIEPAVLEATKFFHHVNFSAETDQRCRVEPSDGRNYLLCSSKLFDVIISEPSNPWQAGVCNLFTKEYFQITKEHLTKNGRFAMWCQLNEVSPKNLREVIAALHDVYPTVYLFDSGQGDMCAVASAEPFKINLELLKKTFADNSNSELFKKFGTGNFAQFISRLTVGPDGVHGATVNTVENTDDLNHLEFDVAKSYESKSFHKDDELWLQSISGDLASCLDFGNLSNEKKSELMAEIGLETLRRNGPRGLYWLNKSYQTSPNVQALSALIELSILRGSWTKVDELFREADKQFPDDPKFLNLKAMQSLVHGDFEAARKNLESAIKRDPVNPLYKYRLAQTFSSLYCASPGQSFWEPSDPNPSIVVNLLKEILQDKVFVKKHPESLLFAADASIQLNHPDEALSLLQNQRNLLGNSEKYWRLMGRAFACKKDWARFKFCEAIGMDLGGQDAANLIADSQRYWEGGEKAKAILSLKRLFDIFPSHVKAFQLLEEYAQNDESARKLLIAQRSKIN